MAVATCSDGHGLKWSRPSGGHFAPPSSYK
ncbi:uncharacterized protein G2W53_001052 [Senna tora]|uniref:Uncharacterized protein n=1 Tax=Senna tora TaxID=362788 RepID=A0A834XH28_9FABA|nr:uncharacterized protein G2W53_001052 [Senna tora]